ncbi:long-chain-fatty-acid--CoA ligase 4-like isoform X2 [Sitodiplosis mosellana]|uniref:long-chain-fatty-acid--CoA ligase 4-like isoform X2 n=1 Tax=Sitodiplosis mosellana TaxID=263140 RepID=UPI0024442C00|nr:long-chain-fatty-acid--CoA ligase 4-like isoform X2 [Sitodiplosis mosellana]
MLHMHNICHKNTLNCDMDSSWVQTAINAIRVVSFVCDVITFPVYLVVQQPWKRRQLSKRVRAKPISADDKEITYRSVEPFSATHVKMVQANVDTMEKMLTYAANTHTSKRCLGTRKILSEEDEIQPNGRVFKKYNMGDYEWRTFAEVEKSTVNFGRGLRELGQVAYKNIVIFAESRAEWMIAAHGCFKQNFPIVTIYATLGEEGVIHGINETDATIVITSHELLPKFKSLLPQLPNVQSVIYMEDQLHETKTDGFKEGVRILPFDEVIKLGSTSSAVAAPPCAEDIAIIMYTSGSTGTPKGVLLTHKNCIATLKAFSDALEVYPDDVLLGFLPLAHVLELLAESLCLLAGVPIGYSTPTTLTDISSKIKQGSKGDASVLKPTAMTTVPLILDRITKGINDQVEKGTPFQKAFFKFAYDYKKKWVRRGYETPILNKFVFSKISKMVGGRVRLMLAGGAPLSPETHEQAKLCLCTDVVQGYGLTETTSGATVMDPMDLSLGRVGAPTTICDIRLVSWEEGNYRVTNKPHPQGEIIIGGDCVSRGYFKLEDKTAEEFFDEDGRRWFKTGDIGEFHEDGVLKIIDRKKDLVKLQAGEYVSLGKVESELKTCPVVDNICVYGESSKHFVIALVVPNQKHLKDLALSLGISDTFENLCSLPALEKAVVKLLEDHGRKCKLQKFEVPAAVKLCKEVWTPDLGLVTAAFKLKRKDIQDRYQADINRMYGK